MNDNIIEFDWEFIEATQLLWWRTEVDGVRYVITRYDSPDIRNEVSIYVGDQERLLIDSDEVQTVKNAKKYCVKDYLSRTQAQ